MSALQIIITLPLLATPGSPLDSIPINGGFVRVYQHAEVPARDKGTIQSLSAKLGQPVKQGQELARLEDSESRVAMEVARLDAELARRQAESGLALKVAQSAVKEAQLDQTRASLAAEVAEKQADSTVDRDQARKTHDTYKRALDRLRDPNGGFSGSFSQVEIEKRKLDYDLAVLELAGAELDGAVARLKARMETAAKNQFGAAVERLLQQVEVAREKQVNAGVTHKLKQQTLTLSEIRHAKRRVLAPLSGEVVEILRQQGEWVEPGTPVLKIENLDRLRIEGFVAAASGSKALIGRSVQIAVGNRRVRGVVTYVGESVDVKGEVVIHAEFDNTKRIMRPGEAVQAIVN